MPTDVLRLGPFVGGLNTASDPSAIADAELTECLNFELDLDGSIVSRPPIQTDAVHGGWTERIRALGVGVFPTGNYVIGSNTNGVYYYLSGAWTLITATFEAACMVQYADSLWLIAKPGSANPGGQWDPTGGFVAQANLPKGEAAVVFKERLFVAPGKNATTDASRLVFSEPANFLDYNGATGGNQAAPGVDFIDVAKGDGQKLVDVIVYRGNLLLFKEDSTYVLAYETNPTDAVVEPISRTVGATQRRCVAEYENTIYIYHEGSIYELINYDFNKINVKCKFVTDLSKPAGTTRAEDVFMTRFGDRLLIRYFNRIYVYGIRTRVWSRWESANDYLHNIGPLVEMPSNVSASVDTVYYAGSSLTEHTKFYRMNDGFNASFREKQDASNVTINARIITKNYDIAASHLFKRLFWWGADVLTNNSVTGTVQPIIFSSQILWGDLINQSKAWNSLGTWLNPLTTASAVSDAVPTGSGTQRRFVRFIKALRFRQAYFQLDLTTDGTTNDGPARIYTITIAAKVKQTVPRDVN